MTTFDEVAIIWGDVETNGLRAHEQELLQVAFLVTDLDLNVLDEQGYEATIGFTPWHAAQARAAAVPFVQKMHDENGLWEAIVDPARSKPKDQVDAEALAYLQSLVPNARTARLGGNSVRLDMNFLDEHLPSVAAHLHYRMFDVSTLTGAAQWWCDVEPMDKVRNHTAMADIRESIAEARYLRERAFRTR